MDEASRGGRSTDDIEATYPLTAMQRAMLLHSLYVSDSDCDVPQIAVRLSRPVDAGVLRKAWQHVVDLHPALRVSLHWQGLSEPEQRVHRHVEVPFAVSDDADLASDGRREARAAWLRGERGRGFDLTRAPLMRVAVLRSDGAPREVVWTVHHALVDGRSIYAVLHQVFASYEAIAEGREPAIARSRPHGDFVEWVTRRDPAAEEAYWREAFAGFRTPTPIGVDRAGLDGREEGRSAGRRTLRLPAGTADALRAFAEREAVTVNTLVQGAWAILLGRYGGEDDVVFGATRAGRRGHLADADAIIGLLMSVAPVRVRLPDAQALGPWLREIRANWVKLREHEHVPLSAIQSWTDVPGHLPLFETIVDFEPHDWVADLRAAGGIVADATGEFINNVHQPLTVFAMLKPELEITIGFDRSRFRDATVDRMLGHLGVILEAMAAGAAPRLADVPVLTQAERRRLLVEWNGATRVYPRDACIQTLFEEHAQRAPDAVAVTDAARECTYEDLNRRANRLAHHIRGRGVTPGMRVGVGLERCLDAVVAILAVLKAGGVYVPLDPAYPRTRLALMREAAGATTVVTRSTFLEALGDDGAICLDRDRDDIDRSPATNPPCHSAATDAAYVMYTSGSTGVPKGIVVPHRAVTRLVRNTDFARLDAAEVLGLLAPLSFDASTFELWGSLLNGGRLVVFPDGIPTAAVLRETITRHGVTTLWLTAGLFHEIVQADVESLRGVRQLLAGGDVLSAGHVRRALEALPGATLINGYGPTEGTTFTCCHAMTDASDVVAPVPIGRPIANTSVCVLDARMRLVPVGVAGELFIGGDGLALGYDNDPGLTAERFVPDPFNARAKAAPAPRLYRTGDRVRWSADGTIEFLGRIDLQVKVRGFRIEPGEIEAALGAHPGVRDAVAIARADGPDADGSNADGPDRPKRLVAYVVAGGDAAAPSARELRAFLGARMPDYMVPSAFVLLDALPLTSNGKVDRAALPAPEAARPDAGSYVAPRTPAEAALAGLWSDVLGIERIGVRDDFFELGGHSLLAVQLFARIRKELGVTVSPASLFRAPTVEALARVIDGTRGDAATTGAVPLRVEGVGAPLFLAPPAGDQVFCFRGLVDALGEDGPGMPCWGLEAPGLDGVTPPRDRVEELSAVALSHLRAVQPSGPYALLGFCNGGVIMYDLARRLVEAGAGVSVLFLLNASPRFAARTGPPAPAKGAIDWRMAAESARRLSGRRAGRSDRDAPRADAASADAPSVPEIIERVQRAGDRAFARYVVPALDARVVIIRATAEPGWDAHGADHGWGAYLPSGAEIRRIACRHADLLEPPHVHEVARIVTTCRMSAG